MLVSGQTAMSFSPFHPRSICLRMEELITGYDDFHKLASWQSQKSWDDLLAELSAAKTKYPLALLSRRGFYISSNAERQGPPLKGSTHTPTSTR